MRIIKNLLLIILLFSCNYKNKVQEKTVEDTVYKSPPINDKTSVIEVDSGTIKLLLSKFTFDRDKFDVNERTWYYPKSRPKFINQNHFYCYFQIVEGKPYNFRFKVQYVSDDWLFIKKAVFLIDEKPYELIPFKINRDNGGGYIWEWFDEQISKENFILLLKLSQAKTVTVKFIGNQYFDTRKIPQKQLQSIAETFRLYWAMGGRF